MSEALDFLLAARPEAMGHYFAFIKEAGRHLDPKTRSLISVITKVHAQTERGLRQYGGRALRDGCTPAEILDALLMAFPALGLTKILWAVDVLRGVDGFEVPPPAPPPAAAPVPPRWHDVIAAAELPVGEARRIACDGRAVFALRDRRGIRVYDSRCPHQGTDIPAEALAGRTLTCPKHGWRFDLREGGACVAIGSDPLARLPSRVVRGRLRVFW